MSAINDPHDSLKLHCVICGSSVPLIKVTEVSVPNTGWSIQLGNYELRCTDHINYISCSYCQSYFDPQTITIDYQGGYPSILCPTHKSVNRCTTCHKWRHIPGDQPSSRHCSEHDDDQDTHQSVVQFMSQQRPTEMSCREMSCREMLLRKLGEVCYSRYVAAKREKEIYNSAKLDEELNELLELIDKEEL